MDVKSAFINGYLHEKDQHHPKLVSRLKKTLYGLKQALRAGFERLTLFIVNKNYSSGNVDNTLFIKSDKNELFFKFMLMILCLDQPITLRSSNL